MKRDMDMIREILFDLESKPIGKPLVWKRTSDPADDSLSIRLEHAKLLVDAGFVEGTIHQDNDGFIVIVVLERLKMKGHDFIAAARNPTVWEKMKQAASERSLSLTLEVAQQVLASLVEKKLGLKE